ncbi:type I-MYXAN CRISPR-associated protein Cas5/Cmx5/DevS [Thiococcus pfennigii]|uniref:type I-MYXAN CRISPR-associated protein Cas5/Cmx5/DevS n=1 Tax=Thiococcus pfennigii TaxID=1057 RepID=UPI00190879E5|nr:type I-MYXAN CRISPR-associated protein Cas5/Cmx5/DevS [Thiococcus pfennigii]MBK1731763.1 type I-MYXAN CRISPR-associated protein Cas5/Cmx5/DevS [Thiococcus pfennigii]
MLWLNVEAPFAAFRTFTAGSFRPTAPFITPSAAYGLLLNLAGIEMRRDDGKSAMTLIGTDLPRLEIALGARRVPGQHSLFQQLHNYPVGSSGKDHAPACKGSKYNIAPARRAFLSDLRALIGVRGDDALSERIHDGLAGRGPKRYGLPFLGDNNFLPSRIDPLAEPLPARWLVPLEEDDAPETDTSPMRLTIAIDRADMSRTTSRLYRMQATETETVPAAAWTPVGY